MSIVVADNFQYKGGKPLDARMKFASVSDMVGTSAADLYDGCFAYVTGTKKYYSYDSSNALDPTLGKWREFSAGAEYSDFTGATSQEAGAHGLVPAPTTEDISKFLKGDGTWATVHIPSFDYSNTSPEAMNFSTDEKVIGTWIDGKPLYQKVFTSEFPNMNSDTDISLSSYNIDVVTYLNAIIIGTDSPVIPAYTGDGINITGNTFVTPNKVLKLRNNNHATYGGKTTYITIRYTKTTDTAVASGEKIVGQWIDGKPLYEKTVDFTSPSVGDIVDFNLGISNASIAMLVENASYIEVPASNNAKQYIPLNTYLRSDGIFTGFALQVESDGTVKGIMSAKDTNWQNRPCKVTIRYTKTTD